MDVGARIRLAVKKGSAAEAGVEAFRFSWAASHSGRLQKLECGLYYFESCPAFLETLDGVTRWASRKGWDVLRSVIGWIELRASEVKRLGARLRQIPADAKRGGRHLLLTHEQMVAIRDWAEGASRKPQHPIPPHKHLHAVAQAPAGLVEAKDIGVVKTRAVRCPAHNDEHPSLVLWSNGGGMCMSCGWKCSWRVERQGQISLIESQGGRANHEPHLQTSAYSATTKTPPGREAADSGDPVGGMVATRARQGGQVLSQLQSYHRPGEGWSRARSPGTRSRRDLVGILKAAERASQREAACERAAMASLVGDDLPTDAVLPDLMVSTASMSRPHWREPWKATVQRWVLVDVDDIEDTNRFTADQAEAVITELTKDPELSGGAAVVQTSPTGLQVWVRLKHDRYGPRAWMAKKATRRWTLDLAGKVMALLEQNGVRGGHVDPTSFHAGRFGRRPGWRMLKDGTVFRASLLASSV